MKRRFIVFLMALILVLGMAQFGVTTAKAADTWDGTSIDTNWYDEDMDKTDYTISTGAELAGLALLVNSGDTATGYTLVNFSGVTITLGDNIDLGGHEWTPIGNGMGSCNFNGTFDGGGHTVSNFAIGTSASPESTLMYIGFFGYTYSDSIIENLNVETAGIYSSYDGAYVGVLAGDEMGSITNCTAAGNVTGGNITTYVGGLTGTSEGDIQNCSAGGDVVCGTGSYAGGLIGQKAMGSLTGCYATGDVTGSDYAGGLVGGYDSTGTLNNCYATGDVTCSGYYGGGFAGYIESSVSGCYATGKVTASGEGACIGGFAGYTSGTLDGCFATGDVQSSGDGDPDAHPVSFPTCAGGFVGLSGNTITRCFASGNVTNTGSYVDVGGFVGLTDNGTIQNCYAAGSVLSGTHDTCLIGGFVGDNAMDIQRSYARGAVSGSGTGTYAGGFAGSNDSGATLGNCYFNSKDSGMAAGIGQDSNSQTVTGLTPDKMTGSAASANMTGLDFTAAWTGKANDSKWYFPQLTVFAGSSDSAVKAASLESVTLTPFTVTFAGNNGSAVASEYGYYTAISEPADPARPGHIFGGWYTTSELTSAYDFSTSVTANITLYAKWTALTLSSSDSDGKIYTGGRITLTPGIDGGEWDWDHSFFSATFNSPATFTALKTGTSTITYTVNGASISYTVTIAESGLPDTGQNFLWVAVMGAIAVLVAGTGILVLKKRLR